jgi:hypothetical protein
MVGWETKEVEGPYSRVNDVPLIVESIFADPEARSFNDCQDASFLAGSGAAFELAEAVCGCQKGVMELESRCSGWFTFLVSLLSRRQPL